MIKEYFEDIQYHHDGMGCGLEDRNITDRYEAMEYGWSKCDDAFWEAIEALEEDIASLLEPLSKVPCPECGGTGERMEMVCYGGMPTEKTSICATCEGEGFIYKYWTPTERDAWREGNDLPPDPWVGAVYALTHLWEEKRSWYYFINTEDAEEERFHEMVCVLGNTPPPKDTYRHEVGK